jgi:hypothetical protein
MPKDPWQPLSSEFESLFVRSDDRFTKIKRLNLPNGCDISMVQSNSIPGSTVLFQSQSVMTFFFFARGMLEQVDTWIVLGKLAGEGSLQQKPNHLRFDWKGIPKRFTMKIPHKKKKSDMNYRVTQSQEPLDLEISGWWWLSWFDGYLNHVVNVSGKVNEVMWCDVLRNQNSQHEDRDVAIDFRTNRHSVQLLRGSGCGMRSESVGEVGKTITR